MQRFASLSNQFHVLVVLVSMDLVAFPGAASFLFFTGLHLEGKSTWEYFVLQRVFEPGDFAVVPVLRCGHNSIIVLICFGRRRWIPLVWCWLFCGLVRSP